MCRRMPQGVSVGECRAVRRHPLIEWFHVPFAISASGGSIEGWALFPVTDHRNDRLHADAG